MSDKQTAVMSFSFSATTEELRNLSAQQLQATMRGIAEILNAGKSVEVRRQEP